MTLVNTPFGPYMVTPFDRSFFGRHYCILSLSDPCPKVVKETFKDIHHFYTFYPKIISPGVGESGNLQFPVSLILQKLHTNLNLWYVSK